MSEAAAVWLQARDGEIPSLLREPIQSAFAGADAANPDTLLESACSSLQRSLEIGSARAAAPYLLAADAFMTWACEASAYQDGALEDLATRAFQRLALLLAESGE